MKNVVSVLAFAASVTATGFRNFPAFPCPANTDNKCTDLQKPGFSFQDLNLGPFINYKDFNFKGFTCGGGFGGGSNNGGNGGGKVIGGSCTPDKKTSPSFGCGPKVDKFSLGSIHVKPEFDCDLEFHYDMPDGSTCKHRNSCKKSGTTVVNSQCGGAKNVTIVFPPQPSKPKPTCSIDIHTISFDCNPPKTTSTRTTTSSTQVSTTSTTPTTLTTSTAPTTSATSTAPPADTSSKTVPPVQSSVVTPPAGSSNTSPVGSTTKPVESSKPPVVGSSKPPVIESKPPVVVSSSVVPVNTPATTTTLSTTLSTTTTAITTTVVTSFQTTSTIFSTVVSTITSCAPTVPNCPGNGVTTTVVTVAVSTTVCPVTETRTTVLTSTSTTAVVVTQTSVVIQPTTSTAVVVVPGTSKGSSVVVPGTTTTTANSPIETLPCPNVVPSCLNTFLFSVGCSDNTDTQCYCPDSIFVKNVFECIYAHGETDTVISEAVLFFQGICAPHIPSNPEIATGATVTKFITVTAAPTSVAPIYTTVIVDTTRVVPCTDEAGATIPSSSSTVVVSTVVTVPQVGFQTASGSVGVIPITAPPQAIQNPTAPAVAPVTTTLATAPLGTGAIRPTKTGAVVTAGSDRVSAGLGFSLAIAMLAAIGL